MTVLQLVEHRRAYVEKFFLCHVGAQLGTVACAGFLPVDAFLAEEADEDIAAGNALEPVGTAGQVGTGLLVPVVLGISLTPFVGLTGNGETPRHAAELSLTPFLIEELAGTFIHYVTDGDCREHLLGVSTLADNIHVLSSTAGIALVELGLGTDEVSLSETVEVHIAVGAVGGTVELVGTTVVFCSHVEHIVLPQRGGIP